MLISIWFSNLQKLKENSSDSEKNTSSFPDKLGEELDEKISITQNDCDHTEFYPSDLLETSIKILPFNWEEYPQQRWM